MALTQVKSDGIATGAVTADQIAVNAVTVDDIADGSISTAKLADDAVTADKLANTAVTAGTYGSSSEIPAITVDAQGRITSASTNTVTQVGGVNGIDFSDNTKVRFGAGTDLEIYHDGSNSYIKENGTGNLKLLGNNLVLKNSADSETYVECANNGAVTLHHDNSAKLATTSSGIDVTGTVTCDGLTSDGQAVFTRSADYQVVCRDSNSTGTAAETGIAFQDSASSVQGFVGLVDSGNDSLYVRNVRNSSIRFGTNNTDRCFLDNTGHFVPMTNNTYDLGTSGNRWRNIYTNDLNLSNEGGTNDVDGTWGSWTIQEGEDDLFLLNRRNGKKYKFNLTEVS